MIDVLLVEDDKMLGKMIATVLSEGGMKVVWVKSGEDALKQLATEIPRLMYLDIMLPGMDGYEVLKQVHANPQYAGLKIVTLSNLGKIEELDKAMELGASDYVVKANIDLAQLVNLTKSKFLAQTTA